MSQEGTGSSKLAAVGTEVAAAGGVRLTMVDQPEEAAPMQVDPLEEMLLNSPTERRCSELSTDMADLKMVTDEAVRGLLNLTIPAPVEELAGPEGTLR